MIEARKHDSDVRSRAMWGDRFQASACGINSDENREMEME